MFTMRAGLSGNAEGSVTDGFREAFVAFLRSPVGVAATIATGAAIWSATAAFSLAALREGVAVRPASRSRGKRNANRRRADALPAADPLTRLGAAVILATTVLLPLTFSIALEDVFAEPKTLVVRLAALAIGTLLAVAVAHRKPILRRTAVDAALLVFLVLLAAATAASVNVELSLYGLRYQYQGLVAFLGYGSLFLGARYALADERRVQMLATALLVGAVLAASYAAVQWLRVDPIWDRLYKGRVFSTVGQANALGSTLAMALLGSIALIPAVRGSRRHVFGAALALIGFGFILTLSRGGYVGLAIGSLVSAAIVVPRANWSTLRQSGRSALIAVAALAVVVVVAVVVWRPAGRLAEQVASRVATIVDPTESSNLSHIDLWTVGWRIALDHPFLGTGPETYVVKFPDYRDEVLSPERAAVMSRFSPESPHNVYLAIASGAGMLALAAYLSVVAGCLWMVISSLRRGGSLSGRLALAGITGAVVVHLVTDSFMTGEPGSTATFWILLGSLSGFAQRAGPSDSK